MGGTLGVQVKMASCTFKGVAFVQCSVTLDPL